MTGDQEIAAMWQRNGRVEIARHARFLVVSSSPAPTPPGWSTCQIALTPHITLYLDHASSLREANLPQRDRVRVIRTGRDGVIVRRDGLGRALLCGTRWGDGVAIGNDPRSLHVLSSPHTPPHARASRLDAHRQGLDRFDTTEGDFIDGLWRVLPGHQCELRDGAVTHTSWWAEHVRELHDTHLYRYDAEALIRRLDDALRSTKARALAVSSGLDSTLLAARCHELGREPLILGSMSFPGLPECDESARILAWNDAMGAPHSELFDMTKVTAFGEDDSDDELLWFGPQGHPGERYERVFARRFSQSHQFDTLMTGVGADQLFEVDPWHVIDELLAGGNVEELSKTHWRDVISAQGLVRVWFRRSMGALWRAHAPDAARSARLARQIFGTDRRVPLDTWQEKLLTRYLERDHVWGEREDLVARQRVLESWEWEGLVRSLWRLEQVSGVRIETPFLDVALWQWGVWMPPSARLNGFGGAFYNKFLLREAHGKHAHLFPEGFARRGKAAVFDEHIRRGMMGPDREHIEDVLEHILDPAVSEHAETLWARVRDGATGRPLVALCRIFTAERWRQSLTSRHLTHE